MGLGGSYGGGDPMTMGRNRLPPWMQPGGGQRGPMQAGGGQQGQMPAMGMPVNQTGGGGGGKQFGLDYQASVPVVQSPYDTNYWGGPHSQPAGISNNMWQLMGAGGGGGGPSPSAGSGGGGLPPGLLSAGGGGNPAYGAPQGPPGGATSQPGQFNPASQDYLGFLRSLFGRR
jgi:hypothetical protein